MPSKSKKTNLPQPTTTRQVENKPPQVPVQNVPTTKPATIPRTSTTDDLSPTVSLSKKATEDSDAGNAQAVNRKKQKRREKEAAKRAADESLNNGYPQARAIPNGQIPHTGQSRLPSKGYFTEEPDYHAGDFLDDPDEFDQEFYSGDEDQLYSPNAGMTSKNWPIDPLGKNKSKGRSQQPISQASKSLASYAHAYHTTSSRPHAHSAHKSGESIWNTSTQAERENIKQFWLELGEEERRSLVKVEKEAVLRKMKEQQKHSCSCSVCGRKRTAIEEELEVLYDAYYEELEQFANHDPDLAQAPEMIAPGQTYKHVRPPGSYPTRGRVQELGEEDDEFDEEDEYDDEQGYSEDDLEDLANVPPDFFTFGNSLTVKDGILTVADDLLKNDGKHFIDMMEQLAERRMQREEDIHYPSTALAHQGIHQGHNHPPLDDEDDFDDEEDDEDYDSQEEEDEYEGDEMDSMTEEQRMEEGRRMFQIFAARMFEQRVLTAYREKVARERQQKLLEELDEEDRIDTQREAKKAKEAAKKKEKKRQQKAAKDEDKARKDAEKAAQEAAVKAEEEKKLEEQRQRKEEQRKKREAERKAADDERLKKEADKQRRTQEERDRQADLERKQREAREREKQKKDEIRKKDREEREAREKEVKEKKAKEDQEKKDRDEHARRDRDVAARVEREARERHHREQLNRRQPVALPPGLHPPSHSSQLQSPLLQVATPIMPPKIPTPGPRHRQTSQPSQPSHGSSPRSQQATLSASRSSVSPPVILPQTPGMQAAPMTAQGQPPMLHHPQPSAPLSPLSNQGRSNQQPFGMNGVSGFPMGGSHGSGPPMMPPNSNQHQMYPGPQARYGATHNMQYPPGFAGVRFPPAQPLAPQQSSQHGYGLTQAQPSSSLKRHQHSRQPSENVQEPPSQPAPIARPGPIGRPPSTTPDKSKPKSKANNADVDQLATQLGSKALLDDSDVPLSADSVDAKIGLPAIGAPGSGRAPLGSAFGDLKHDTFGIGSPSWNGFSPSVASTSSWGVPSPATRPGGGWSQPAAGAFGAIGGTHSSMPRGHVSRPVLIRLLLAQACKQLSPPGSDVYLPVQHVLRQVEALKGPTDPPVSMDEMLAISDTEGNSQNGGGFFEIHNDPQRGQLVRFEADAGTTERVSAGDIGSPIVQHNSHHAAASAFSFGPPGRGF